MIDCSSLKTDMGIEFPTPNQILKYFTSSTQPTTHAEVSEQQPARGERPSFSFASIQRPTLGVFGVPEGQASSNLLFLCTMTATRIILR